MHAYLGIYLATFSAVPESPFQHGLSSSCSEHVLTMVTFLVATWALGTGSVAAGSLGFRTGSVVVDMA